MRGFADPHPAPTPGGDVLTQAGDGIRTGPYALQPEHRSDTPVGYITPHTWDDAQRAWNDGRMDQWLPAKGRLGMGAYGPAELPFQTALADAFTLCEAYHCSMQAGTNPNRLFLWTGANDPRGEAGGPALVSTHDRLGPAAEGYAWTTYPERLQQAGVDWRIYQDMADNFNDNPWPAFANTARRMPPAVTRRCASAPCRPARCKTWRATSPPAACPRSRGSSRPPPTPSIRKSRRRAGGAYTERVLDILTRNPAVWSRCVFFVTYDENDCFYDHVPPPATRAQRRRAIGRPVHRGAGRRVPRRAHRPQRRHARRPAALHGRAFGMGPRVPMLVVSPWSRGGWVNAQVFDHTSVIRFLEARHGVMEPNISAWRRAVAGDLTSALDFSGERDHPDEPPGGHAIQTRRSCACPMRWKPWAA